MHLDQGASGNNRLWANSITSCFILDNLPEFPKACNIQNTSMRPSASLYLGTWKVLEAPFFLLLKITSEPLTGRDLCTTVNIVLVIEHILPLIIFSFGSLIVR